MTTIVKNIRNAAISEISSALGSSWQELDYTFNVELNSFRTNDKRYGVNPRGASSAAGVLKNYTMDHSFEVVLTNGYKNRANSDQDQEDALYDLYDAMSDIIIRLSHNQLGLSGTVMDLTPLSIDDPEFLDENNIIALRAIFVVKYREQITV